MDKRFGRRLRSLRRKRKMAIVEVAGPMGWSVPYLSDIETGKKNPPVADRIEELAGILDAKEHLAELLELAIRRRGAVVFPIGPDVRADVFQALLELCEAHRRGKIGVGVTRTIRQALKKNKAVA
jgi:transcriptional regulator with XRE-family HTH domain